MRRGFDRRGRSGRQGVRQRVCRRRRDHGRSVGQLTSVRRGLHRDQHNAGNSSPLRRHALCPDGTRRGHRARVSLDPEGRMLEATILEERRWTSAPRRAIAMPDTRGGARWVVALIVLVIVGLALRLYEFRGFGALDDAAYAQIAHQMASGMFRIGAYNGPAVFPLRVGIIYPTALFFRHAGVSEWTMVLFPFAISILSIVLIYVATNHCFVQRAAVIGAALWAILPLDAFQASVLAPDLPAAFFSSLGIFGIIWTIDSRIRRTGALLFCGLAAGAALGVSWLCKESVAYAAPFCAGLVVAALRKDRRRCVVLWAGVALGAVTVLAGEMTVYHRATGDWLFHFHETERNYHQYKNAFFVAGSSLTSPHEHSYARAVLRRL